MGNIYKAENIGSLGKLIISINILSLVFGFVGSNVNIAGNICYFLFATVSMLPLIFRKAENKIQDVYDDYIKFVIIPTILGIVVLGYAVWQTGMIQEQLKPLEMLITLPNDFAMKMWVYNIDLAVIFYIPYFLNVYFKYREFSPVYRITFSTALCIIFLAIFMKQV